MSDISKEELKKEIAAILKDADLTSTSSKKVRQEIAEKLDIDLSSRRKEIDELVMEYIEQDKSKSKKNGNVEEDDDDEEEENDDEEEDEEEEEEEEEVKKPKRGGNAKKAPPAKRAKAASSEESEEASDDEGDDEYSPKKKSPKKAAAKRGGGSAGRKKKGGSDDDSDEDWGKGKKKRGGGGAAKKAGGAKRGGGGYTKAVNLSPELAAIMGEDSMPRHEVVKRVWAIIKERNLYDPKNKQFAICDDELLTVFGIKRFRTFGMMKFLKNHFRDN